QRAQLINLLLRRRDLPFLTAAARPFASDASGPVNSVNPRPYCHWTGHLGRRGKTVPSRVQVRHRTQLRLVLGDLNAGRGAGHQAFNGLSPFFHLVPEALGFGLKALNFIHFLVLLFNN
ncbi:MAG: hypothetical protein ACK559_38500, partial [bacterium]